MGFIARFNAVLRVMRRKKRPMEGAQLLRQRPALLLGVNAFETALLASGRLSGRIKALARVKTSALVGCPFWLDIGSAVGREMGVTEEQLLDLNRYESSHAFDAAERAAIDLAVAMAKTPTEIPVELTNRLREHFDQAQLVELAATIGWENYLARFNRVFGVRSSGFSEGAFCPMPEKHTAPWSSVMMDTTSTIG